MAEICPVCNKEIKAEDREEYKFSSESSPIPVHNSCSTDHLSDTEMMRRMDQDLEDCMVGYGHYPK